MALESIFAYKLVNEAVNGAKKLFKGGKSKSPLPSTVKASVEGKHPDPSKSIDTHNHPHETNYSPKSTYPDDSYGKHDYTPEHHASAATYAILALPLVGAAAWLTFLLNAKIESRTSALLSPPSNTILITLSVFVVLYTIFLIFVFLGHIKATNKSNY